jgi:hypothetical protein
MVDLKSFHEEMAKTTRWVQELRSLGVKEEKIRIAEQNHELEDLTDSVKQAMIRKYAEAYKVEA